MDWLIVLSSGMSPVYHASVRHLQSHNRPDNLSSEIGQPLVAAVVEVGEPLVVKAELVEDGRVDVSGVDRVLHGLVADLVGRAVDRAPLDPAAGHPYGEAVRIVVAA